LLYLRILSAALTTYLGKDLLEQVCNSILTNLEAGSTNTDVSQAYLHTVGAIRCTNSKHLLSFDNAPRVYS
jgi:hypothetical protein